MRVRGGKRESVEAAKAHLVRKGHCSLAAAIVSSSVGVSSEHRVTPLCVCVSVCLCVEGLERPLLIY